ncbi:MAG: LEA type 2 family protein [Chitinophagaceae bacterium]|nr:LEA type 2 family protein [Chitinophagaceae bacterium]MCW5905770.1 LEA type 2 family protein [Chitinophagaceae bacterium]
MLVRIRFSLLIVLGIVIIASCGKPQNLEYRDIRNIEIKALGFDKSAITLDLVYYNPNNVGITLKKVVCDIFVNEQYLGKYTLDTLMHIPRRSEFILPSHVNIEMKGIYKNLLAVLFNKEILLHVKGTARIGKAGIFITMPFNYSGKHTFSIL